MRRKNLNAAGILTKPMLKFVAAWQGDPCAAARAAGYSKPPVAACKLIQNPIIAREIRRKQRIMTEESAKRLAGQLNFDRSHVLNRLWEISQISPKETNSTLGAQVKAAQALTAVFADELKQIAEILPHLHGRSPEEVKYWIRHGQFPEQNAIGHLEQDLPNTE